MCRHFVRPVPHDFQVFLLARGKQEQHTNTTEPFRCSWLSEVVGNAAHDPVRLRAVQRPGLTVSTKYGDLHGDRPRLASNDELESAISCFSIRQDPAKLNTWVDISEPLSVNRFNKLTLLKFPGRRCG